MNQVTFAPSTASSSNPISPDVTGNVVFSIISIGTSITAQPQMDVSGNGDWQNVGTSASAVGTQTLSGPRSARFRWNVSAITGAASLAILS